MLFLTNTYMVDGEYYMTGHENYHLHIRYQNIMNKTIAKYSKNLYFLSKWIQSSYNFLISVVVVTTISTLLQEKKIFKHLNNF